MGTTHILFHCCDHPIDFRRFASLTLNDNHYQLTHPYVLDRPYTVF